jgi:tetratricopeptide (TPR) repeat protein
MSESSSATVAALRLQQAGDLAQAEQFYRRVLRDDPGQAEALHGLGAIAYQRGAHDQAIAWLRRALASCPDNPVLHSNLGAAHRAAGQPAEAEACYRQALRLQPDCADACNNLGNVLREQGRPAEAVARYRQAVLARPAFAEAHLNLGLALREQGQWQQALAHFRQAARFRPGYAEVHGHMARLLWEQGRRDEAVEQLRQALRARPDGLAEHLILAAALQEQGRLDEATTLFREALRRQPSSAAAHHGLGAALARQGRLDEAVPHLEEAVRLEPHLPGAQYLLGHALRAQGRPDRAVPHLVKAFLLSHAAAPHPRPLCNQPAPPPRAPRPQGPADGLAARARAALREGRPEEALTQCREALRLDPDCVEAHVVQGLLLGKQGRLQEASTAFLHALRVEPAHAEAALHLGTALREQGRLERAAAYLEYALDLQPGLAAAHSKRGLVLSDLGELEAAAAAYREALRLEPDLVPALSHLGILLEELSQPEEGQRLLERALDLGAGQPQVHVHYGLSLANQGRLPEARAQFLQALAGDPDCAAALFFLARDGTHSFTDADLGRMRDLLRRDTLRPRDRINLHFALAHVLDRAGNFDEAFRHCDQGNAHKRDLLRLQGNAFQPDAHARLVARLIDAFPPGHFERTRSFGSASDLPVFIVGMPRSGTSLVEQILASHPAVFGAGEIRALGRFIAELPAALSSPAEYPECLAGLGPATSRLLAQRYVDGLRRLGGEKLRVTDKTPTNFHHLGLIATFLPGARIIHCRRDPRDTCWSCYFQNFREVPFACDLALLGAYYREYDRLLGHWKEVLPVPILEVRYEELVEDPGRVSRAILAHCGLPWDDACARFYETRRLVRTASNLQVRRPVYKGSVGYWKNYAAHLGPLLQALTGLGEGRRA